MVLKIELSLLLPEDSILMLDVLFPGSVYHMPLFLSFILVKPIFQELSKKALMGSKNFHMSDVCTGFPSTLIVD